MDIGTIISKGKELVGLSWKTIILCLGAVCGWLIVGGCIEKVAPLQFLDLSLRWLELPNIDVVSIEKYILNRAAAFQILAIILALMVAVFAYFENMVGDLLTGTYGAVANIRLLLIIILDISWLFWLCFVVLTIEMWILAYMKIGDDNYKILGVFVFSILLISTLLYPLLLLARILFPSPNSAGNK